MQYDCEDVLGDAGLLDALGLGLGRRVMADVAMAVKQLGEDPRKGVATVSARAAAVPTPALSMQQ